MNAFSASSLTRPNVNTSPVSRSSVKRAALDAANEWCELKTRYTKVSAGGERVKKDYNA